MLIKKLKLKSLFVSLLLVMPIFSFAANTALDKANFKNMYGGEIKPEAHTNILNSCDKNDNDIESCMSKFKAKSTLKKSSHNGMGYSFCCLNVSGRIGEYLYYRGQEYCVPPC